MTVRTVIVDGVSIEVELTEEADGTWSARVGDRAFTIEMPNAPAPKRRSSGGGKRKVSGSISANIPGKIVSIDVDVGQTVKEGQVVLILEAMKMQNEIVAPIDGTVASIQCEEGASIEANVPLVLIEPFADSDEA